MAYVIKMFGSDRCLVHKSYTIKEFKGIAKDKSRNWAGKYYSCTKTSKSTFNTIEDAEKMVAILKQYDVNRLFREPMTFTICEI